MQAKFRLDAQTVKRSFQLIGLLMAFACSSFGNTIKFTDVVTASGTIGSTSFTNAVVTISGVADTSNIVPFPQGFFVNDSSASITIAGLGTFPVTTGTEFFLNNFFHTVLFTHSNAGPVLIAGPINSAFSSWSMMTSIGPITGSGQILQWGQCNGCTPVVTTGGTVILNNALPTDVTFEARTEGVPEPGTLLLFGTGLLSVVGAVRRKLHG